MFSKPCPDKLMVVAHPDDESIFGGGALLSEHGWKVICLTNGSNEVRSREFKHAMKFAQARWEIWDYPDVYDGSFDEVKVKQDISRVLAEGNYKKVVTHNLNGEYGHSQHRALSRIMHQMVLDRLYVFDISSDPLPFNMLYKKLKLLQLYKSQMYVIEELMSFILFEKLVKVNSVDSSYSLS